VAPDRRVSECIRGRRVAAVAAAAAGVAVYMLLLALYTGSFYHQLWSLEAGGPIVACGAWKGGMVFAYSDRCTRIHLAFTSGVEEPSSVGIDPVGEPVACSLESSRLVVAAQLPGPAFEDYVALYPVNPADYSVERGVMIRWDKLAVEGGDIARSLGFQIPLYQGCTVQGPEGTGYLAEAAVWCNVTGRGRVTSWLVGVCDCSRGYLAWITEALKDDRLSVEMHWTDLLTGSHKTTRDTITLESSCAEALARAGCHCPQAVAKPGGLLLTFTAEGCRVTLELGRGSLHAAVNYTGGAGGGEAGMVEAVNPRLQAYAERLAGLLGLSWLRSDVEVVRVVEVGGYEYVVAAIPSCIEKSPLEGGGWGSRGDYEYGYSSILAVFTRDGRLAWLRPVKHYVVDWTVYDRGRRLLIVSMSYARCGGRYEPHSMLVAYRLSPPPKPLEPLYRLMARAALGLPEVPPSLQYAVGGVVLAAAAYATVSWCRRRNVRGDKLKPVRFI
jgi:hypothetical protein